MDGVSVTLTNGIVVTGTQEEMDTFMREVDPHLLP